MSAFANDDGARQDGRTATWTMPMRVVSTDHFSVARVACSTARVIALVCTLTCTAASARTIAQVRYPQIAAHAAAVEGLVPTGWRVEQRLQGDLDRDGRNDVVLVLKMTDAANVLQVDERTPEPLDTNPRMLIAALMDPAGGYRTVTQDHALIPRGVSTDQDESLDESGTTGGGGVGINTAGTVTVTLSQFASMGSWQMGETSFNFRYQDGCLRLIGYERSTVQRNTGETNALSINYLTGRAWRTQGSVDHDGEPPKRWLRLPKQPLQCLEQVGDGLMFNPKIE
ncbi:hypothetical protein [Xanthomonas campestris]|uniref:hypothetical protein n=1 Tax=Xanthomonas campestris TaxID=339 RepID=UPI001E31E34A|nr:hypothetical protein [Xanthomonas campestris]MCC5053773.1 hypothetical protein [Xanthomonas campestris pv. aberrans]MDM7672727.1 hypothetical protein [Xanthomonas campestris pv. campestris]MDM7679037.1 hypothetical protein [Xanthomonas campestris pv. campestris]MDM7684960.1 hypothetical protein [Xanthomonas campestris pv. campestris]MDM7689514.1 hypothetical protein [Xanthomonas campestris pv. campestris]